MNELCPFLIEKLTKLTHYTPFSSRNRHTSPPSNEDSDLLRSTPMRIPIHPPGAMRETHPWTSMCQSSKGRDHWIIGRFRLLSSLFRP
ncbi:hypothetical protein TNIN_144451 [Trichonephila inaurata madagascariensis]|uniref:Uncharacterized protein n=1 Tax=Trichonephila inaurata madagascariensis TaxID=2747483 RepID=A0A8X6MCS3_9ARAC|nr:hypothetical protein TNIN_144451 [Trichonephila inaurata madagascariensis]